MEEQDQVKEHLRGLSGYNERGEELPDSRPVALPVGFRHPKSIQQTIRDLIQNEEYRAALDRVGVDTFDEADDLSDDDSDGFQSPYEEDFDPLGVVTREHEIRSGFVEEIPPEKKEKARELSKKTKEFFDSQGRRKEVSNDDIKK